MYVSLRTGVAEILNQQNSPSFEVQGFRECAVLEEILLAFA